MFFPKALLIKSLAMMMKKKQVSVNQMEQEVRRNLLQLIKKKKRPKILNCKENLRVPMERLSTG